MAAVIAFLVANKVAIFSILLFIVSEVMALVPGIKANGIMDLIVNMLKGLGAVDPEK